LMSMTGPATVNAPNNNTVSTPPTRVPFTMVER
jgi:hypothetical protein